jgi:predicted nucleotidyltransferase component of viral defense system
MVPSFNQILIGEPMNSVVYQMLEKYQLNSARDAENALKEIIQEITLLGLHRAKFFEKAAFYGGTALRTLYSLTRFSEDLDFTLFKPEREFSLTPYFSAVTKELESYGFQTSIMSVDKKVNSEIESAFIKANTKVHLIKVAPLKSFASNIQANARLKIKFEVDIDPAQKFEVETKYLLEPTSFPVIALKKPDLFAGKLHALLFRNWKTRVKGRDFYDYVWYLKERTPVRLAYLREKAIQSGHIKSTDLQNLQQLKTIIQERIASVDLKQAKNDVLPFIKNPKDLDVWSQDFFSQITENIEVI